jgi:hypothetical protein
LLIALIIALLPGPLADRPILQNPIGGLPALAAVSDRAFLQIAILLTLQPLLVASGASLLVRFWRARGVERQQLKWIAYAIGVLVGTFLVTMSDAFGSWGDLLSNVAPLGVPLSMAVAVLRYRLYDIDVIIRRTLIYGLLTAALGLVYGAGVALSQQLLRPLTQGSDLAIVGSTLAVAGLFQPLRQRIQLIVDRRFYRQRYDAMRTLDAFSSCLRSEVDLDSLGAELLAVVDETMQPQRLSLWLRPPAERKP